MVGRIVCEQQGATIEVAEIRPAAVKPFASALLQEKLALLVMSVAGDPCRSLLALRSSFWSFVEIPGPGNEAAS